MELRRGRMRSDSKVGQNLIHTYIVFMSAKNEELNIPSSLIFLECMKFFMHGNNSILLADSSRIIKIESQLELFIHELVLLV